MAYTGESKSYVKLTIPYFSEDSPYSEENCLLPSGARGLFVTVENIFKMPDLSAKKRTELIHRLHQAYSFGESGLLFIADRFIAMPVWMWEFTHSEGGRRWGDEEEFRDYLEEIYTLAGVKKKNASTS